MREERSTLSMRSTICRSRARRDGNGKLPCLAVRRLGEDLENLLYSVQFVLPRGTFIFSERCASVRKQQLDESQNPVQSFNNIEPLLEAPRADKWNSESTCRVAAE